MFPPFAGITYPYVRSPLAQRIAPSCFVLHLIAVLFIVFPLRDFFPVDSETGADVRVFDYTEDDPSLPEQPGKPPLDHQISPITSLYCLQKSSVACYCFRLILFCCIACHCCYNCYLYLLS